MQYKEAIDYAIVEAMRNNDKVVLFGQGVTDLNHVFGTTASAHEEFPDRVMETGINETMMTGACVGLAMEGYKPVLVHARADWSLLSFEHLINTGAKLPFLHGKPIPFVMRVLVGRGWGQGPVHSQSFHHMLSQVPGLNVYMPATPTRYVDLFRQGLRNEGPTIIFEPRRFYDTEVDSNDLHGKEHMEWGVCDVNIATIGDTVLDGIAASKQLESMGISSSVVPWEDLGSRPGGANRGPVLTVDIAPRRPEPGLVAPPFIPQGVSPGYEKAWYPTSDDIVAEACRMLGKNLPKERAEHESFAPTGSPF